MNTKLLLFALLPLFILGGCAKEKTETRTTTVKKPYVAPNLPFWGSWLKINADPTDTSKTYFELNEKTGYCARMEERENGLRELEYSTVLGTDKLVRYDWNSYLPYEMMGDTMVVYQSNGPGIIEEKLLRLPAGSLDAENWIKPLTVVRKSSIPSDNYSIYTDISFGIDGDFLYINQYYNPTGDYRFYKLNTLNGMFVDSVDVPGGNWHALYFRGGSNKLYNTRYSGTYNMQQMLGLTGVNSNLSSNSINSVRSISMNATSGTVFAATTNTIYSGSEGGSFSSLYTFTGNYPQGVVYYKNDQFLGVYNNTLVLFEISPTFKVIKQYRLAETSGSRIYRSMATNGNDIWIMSRNDQTSRYSYYKVTLP